MSRITIYTTPNGVMQITEGKKPESWTYQKDGLNVCQIAINEKTFLSWQGKQKVEGHVIKSNQQLLHD